MALRVAFDFANCFSDPRTKLAIGSFTQLFIGHLISSQPATVLLV